MIDLLWVIMALLAICAILLSTISRNFLNRADRIEERLYDIARLAAGCDKAAYQKKYARPFPGSNKDYE